MKISLLLPFLTVLAFSAATTQAANITWGSATNITGDANVSTNGTLVGAYHFGSGSTTVNGVTFGDFALAGTSSTAGNFTLASPAGLFTASGSNPSAPFSSLSASYQTLVGTYGFASGAAAGPMTFTITGLTIGTTYESQFWVNRSNSSVINMTNATAGNTVVADWNTTDSEGGLGQFAIGTFIADNATQVITFGGSQSHIFNAFQLRQISGSTVPEPGSSIALLFLSLGALFGASRFRSLRFD